MHARRKVEEEGHQQNNQLLPGRPQMRFRLSALHARCEDHGREAQERYDSTPPDREPGLTDLLVSTRHWRICSEAASRTPWYVVKEKPRPTGDRGFKDGRRGEGRWGILLNIKPIGLHLVPPTIDVAPPKRRVSRVPF